MIIVAIDPGIAGAIAVIKDGKATSVQDLPVAGESKSQRSIVPSGLSQILQETWPELCVVERVASRPGEGVSSAFRFGTSYGICYAVPAVLGIPVERVTPQTWKRHFNLTKMDKEDSRLRALDLAPDLAEQLSRKKDHNRAEAVLLGLYMAHKQKDQSPVRRRKRTNG